MDLIDCPAMLCWWIKVWRNQFFHLKLAAEYGWNYAISKANDWVKTRVGKLPKCPQFREKVVTVSWIFADSWYQHVVDTPGSLPANPTVNGIPSELCRTCLQGPRSPPTRTMQQHDSFPKSWHTPFFSQWTPLTGRELSSYWWKKFWFKYTKVCRTALIVFHKFSSRDLFCAPMHCCDESSHQSLHPCWNPQKCCIYMIFSVKYSINDIIQKNLNST